MDSIMSVTSERTNTNHSDGRGSGGAIVPYITRWSLETPLPYRIVERATGIAYADEILGDRDSNGVLWVRTPSSQGQGRPEFGNVHSARQRISMRKLLCQVCGGSADQSADGILWVLKDHRGDWPDWPNRMGVTEPPICLPCLRVSVCACPALRRGHVIIRARHAPIAGVHGTLYAPGMPVPVPVGSALVAFGDPAIQWLLASNLVRQLFECTIEDLT